MRFFQEIDKIFCSWQVVNYRVFFGKKKVFPRAYKSSPQIAEMVHIAGFQVIRGVLIEFWCVARYNRLNVREQNINNHGGFDYVRPFLEIVS